MRALLREFVSGLGGPRASRQRLTVAAWVRLLVVVPVIFAPTAVAMLEELESDAVPPAGRHLITVWMTIVVAYVPLNVGIVLLGRGSAPPDRAAVVRGLTFACLAGEVATNALSSYGIGTLTSAGGVYVALIVAIYRVFFDYELGLCAALLGATLYALFSLLELSGAVAMQPLLDDTVIHPLYDDTSKALVVLQAVVLGTLMTFAFVNYGVNQSVKLHRYITESVLRRYLAPSLVERAARGELRLDAPPERRTVTVMFSDLVGFTSLSERLGPDRVGRLLNRYLSQMANIAHAHGGTIDKFVGDAVMIVFGAPDPLEPSEQARRCVALAKELRAKLPEIDQEVRLETRTGINTGEAVVGNFGSLARSDFTVIGPAVNVAARLETASQPGRILIGESTARLLGDTIPLEPAGELPLKGVSQPVRAYFVG